MILVDTTVWIDYFTGRFSPETRYLEQALDTDEIVVGDIILCEVLQGFRLDSDFEQAKNALGVFRQASMMDPHRAIRSAVNYRYLRKRGITVRKTIDCFIATFCIDTGLPILHRDRDFDPFEDHLGLTVIHAAGA
ncbi:MAG: PIN domain nuclease [Spirochaetota bacterium]